MASRGGQRAFRSLITVLARNRVYNVSESVRRSCITSIAMRSLSNFPPRIFSNIPEQQHLNRRYFADDHGSEESIEDQTMNVLKLFDKVDPSKVSLVAHFINDLGLDSLDVVEVVMAFEDEFGIEISDEEAEKIHTMQQAVDLIKAKLDS